MRIRFTSFLLPPLPKEIYIKYYPYKNLKHWANKGFYGTGSIKKAIEYIEKEVAKQKHGERFK